MSKILLHNIKVRVTDPDPDEKALSFASSRLRREGIFPKGVSVAKKSIDARKKGDIFFLYSVAVETEKSVGMKKMTALDAVELKESKLDITFGEQILDAPPVVVGFGPCGMFHALLLAENGYRPIVLERGGNVRERQSAVNAFYRTGILDPEQNIQFGAGGAGTFSDGKLITRINDPKCSYVLERLCEFGAPGEILTCAKPHIGTDLLMGIVDRIAHRITDLGGRIEYHTKLIGMRTDGLGKVIAAVTDCGEIPCGTLTLAPGHSSRDTYLWLMDRGIAVEPKAFSVGVRIEHLQQRISEALYGDFAPLLPPGEYGLSKRIGDRGVYSFCMCPGGVVVAATSEEGAVVTNGMSYHARDGKNANSALAVSVFPSDVGGTPASAIAFQRSLEQAAYRAGGANYNAPLQTVGDFLSGKSGSEPTDVQSTYMGGGHFALCDLHQVLPPFVTAMLETGIQDFGRKIPGFDCPSALLTGVESRTSAPLRILRGPDGAALEHGNFYPAGEGAGYAGGITSAAVDGIHSALAIMRKYKPVCG
ncbi:MAG: NAD(P)/FAD-dependent oxidoreductase [Eubacteriales bacterium]